MKTKLIALLLLVAMAVTVLAGCAYNYQDEDLSAYATVDADALYDALHKLVIEDGDFTSDPATRTAKTLKQFATTLAEAIGEDDDRQKTEGAVAEGDYVVYLYYCLVADADNVNHSVNTAYMAADKESSLLLTDNEGVSLQIQKALVGLDVADLCEQKTDGTLPASGLALVSYTYSTSDNSTEKKLTNVLLDLSDTENALVKALLDRHATDPITLGEKFATAKSGESDPKLVVTTGEGDDELQTTYSDITVSSVITGTPVTAWDDEGEMKPIVESPYLEYTAEKLLEVTLTDMYGNSVTASTGTTFQYQLYPIRCVGMPDLSEDNLNGAVEEILFSILGDDITVNDLTVFKSTDYTSTDGEGVTTTVDKIIAALVTDTAAHTKAETARDTAKDAVTKAQTAVDAAQKALDEAEEADKAAKQEALDKANTTLTEAQTALTKAEDDLTAAAAKVDPATVIASLEACVNEDGETAVQAIYDEYYQSLYDALETAYNNEIFEHVYAAIGELFFQSVTYTGELPEKAVDEALDRNLEAYEYEYYEGTDSDSKAYVDLYDDLTAFLCAKAKAYDGTEATTKKEAEAVLRKEAEEQVKDTIAVYVLADALNAKYEDAELILDKDAAKTYATLQAALYNQSVDEYYAYLSSMLGTTYDPSGAYVSADYYISLYGETNLRTAYLADLVMAFMTETVKDSTAEDFGGADAIDFKNITFTVEADED